MVLQFYSKFSQHTVKGENRSDTSGPNESFGEKLQGFFMGKSKGGEKRDLTLI